MTKPPPTQKALLAALVLALVAAIGMSLMHGDDGPALGDDATPATATRTGAAEAADGGFRRSDAEGPTDASASGAAGNERAAALGDDMGSGRPLPDDARWIELLVVDKVTGSPQPDALVHWYDESAYEFASRKLDGNGDDEDADVDGNWDETLQSLFRYGERVAGAAGWRTRADADGKARVTLGKEWTNVAVTHGALYGELNLRDNSVPPAGGYRVELVPDVAVTVRVVDERGEPCAAFPVGLAALDAANTDAVLNVSDVALAFTDAKGLATIPHLQSHCATGPEASGSVFSSRRWRWGRARAPEGAAPPKPVWHVRALLVGSRDKGVAFDHAAPPTEPLELRLPPTGKLRVRAENGGKLVTDFRMAYANRSRGEHEEWNPLDRGAQAKPEADGWARFPHVALGLRFDLYADAEGGMRGAHAGPTAAGQEVDAVLRSADDRIFVAGRLLTPERTPAHNVRISVRAVGEGIWMHEVAKTDGEGRFHVNLGSADEPQVAQKLWIETVVKDGMPQRGEVPGRALRNGREELGDVVLGDAPLLVAGVVLGDGKPLAGEANLVVERQLPPQDGQREGEWRWIDGQYAHKDKDGRFVVRGPAEPGVYRLNVGSERALPHDPIPFRLGADDLKVDLRLGGKLAASALLPPKTPAEQVRFTLVPSKPPGSQARPMPNSLPNGMPLLGLPPGAGGQSGGQSGEHRANVEVDAQGRADARWDTLPPDTYTLRIELWMQGRELASIPDVVVPPPATPDPRLVDIDLRAAVRVVQLAIRGADGKPPAECYGAAFVTNNARGDWRGEQLWEADLDLLLAPGPYELLVCVQGHRPLPVRGDGPRVEARIEAWPQVTVRLANPPKLPEGASVRAWLVGPTMPPAKYETAWSSGDRSEHLQASGEMTPFENGVLRLPIGDGLHTLHLGVYNDNGGHEIALTPPVTVLPNQTEIAVTVPDAEWQKAITGLPKDEDSVHIRR